MIPEIDSAVEFLSNILRATYSGRSLSPEQLTMFQQSLATAFQHRCHGHWFPERPSRGSAYRCVRIVNSTLDRDLTSAANAAGVSESQLRSLLPSELTLWIDPDEVSYRIGEDGSVGVIYEARSADDSNANIMRSSAFEAPYPAIHYSGFNHHGLASTNGLRVSPDTVNAEYIHSYGHAM